MLWVYVWEQEFVGTTFANSVGLHGVDALGRHALSCRWSKGRFQQHVALNDIIKQGLSAAHVPSKLKPAGLLRLDGK